MPHSTHVNGRIVSHRALNIRSGPGTGYRVIGSLRAGSTEHLIYKVNGSKVAGNKRWYKLADHRGYVSARYVRNLNYVPWR
ncbi:SH3 domain-containing protein [Streptomyces chiangmaiensis]